jgi:hypothetical protein
VSFLQSLQVAALLTSLYSPLTQGMHDVCSANDWAYPSGHCLHSFKLDESVYWPGEQSEQIVSPVPVVSSNCPAKQSLHEVLPSAAKRPVAHEMQAEDPSTSDFVCTAQSVQLLLKVAPWFGFFFPAAHLLQSSKRVTPFAEEYRPAMHLIHETSIMSELATFGL